jgi:hypothetical protein
MVGKADMMTLRSHVLVALLAIIVALLAFFGIGKLQKLMLHPDTFMTVSVTVPDFGVGDNPVVDYRRQIHRDMRGVWTVEIRPLNGSLWQCTGSGAGLYSPSEPQHFPLPLSVYSGSECNLPAGQYIMATHWSLTDHRGNAAVVTNITKPFSVSP